MLLSSRISHGSTALGLLLCLTAAACDTSGVTEPDAEPDIDVVVPETDTTPVVDSEADPDAITDTADVPGPVFEIGTNVTGANTPDSFTPLVDGDELNIELGFQGLWMVVLAFRSRDVFQGQLTIITRLSVDGTVLGELGLAKQKVHPGGNDLYYYYNLFLVVSDPNVAGMLGNITLTISDEVGTEIEEILQVQLTGGAAP